MKLFYEYMVINLSPTSSHLRPLQVENCDRNSRLVVDEEDNRKFRLERVNINKRLKIFCIIVCKVNIQYDYFWKNKFKKSANF